MQRIWSWLFRRSARALPDDTIKWRKQLALLLEGKGDGNKLKNLLEMDRALYNLILVEGGRLPGAHPKHEFLRYTQWFCLHMNKDDMVLDVGCGKGELTTAMAEFINGSVLGVEIEQDKIDYCQKNYTTQKNLKFMQGDICQIGLETLGEVSVVTLSNVLEHIEDRQDLLAAIYRLFPRLLLVRVPQYDRDWRVPVKEKWGIDSRLDPTHELEYTEAGLVEELQNAHFEIVEKKFNWGEIWVSCRPIK